MPPMNMESRIGPRIVIDGNPVDYFGGTSYYALHTHPEVIKASMQATEQWGVGLATSRRGLGNNALLDQLESEAAGFLNEEQAIVLPTGYLSPMAGLLAIGDRFDIIFIDESAHSSDMLAAKASGKQVVSCKHLDLNDLDKKLRTHSCGGLRPLIVSDGMFPSTGELAPLENYLELAGQYDGLVWLDEAHSFGIIGPNGRGLQDLLSCASDKVLSGGTLGKAFGGYGGIIPCSDEIAVQLRTTPVYTGASPLPMPAAAAALTGIQLLRRDDSFRHRLWNNAGRLRAALNALGVNVSRSNVPVIAFSHGSKDDMAAVQQALLAKGIWIQHSLNYSGVTQDGLLRMVVTSEHSSEQISRLTEVLGNLL